MRQLAAARFRAAGRAWGRMGRADWKAAVPVDGGPQRAAGMRAAASCRSQGGWPEIGDGPVVRSCLTFNCGEFAMDGLSLNLVATAAGRSGEPECGSSLPLDFARLAARGGAWEEPTGRRRSRWTAARSELRECERQRAAAVRGGGMKSSSRLQSTVMAVPRTSMVVFLVIWRARAGPTRGGGGRGGW